jgi:hypothetical protein
VFPFHENRFSDSLYIRAEMNLRLSFAYLLTDPNEIQTVDLHLMSSVSLSGFVKIDAVTEIRALLQVVNKYLPLF